MKPKLIPVLEMCIEIGLSRGWDKAHKHEDNPSPEKIQDEQALAVANEIYEWFDMEELDRG